MPHLNIETLARLVEETTDSHEAEHLDHCADCSSELEGLKADAAALSELAGIEPPSAQWPAVEQRLIAEGLLRAPARRRFAHNLPARRWTMPLLQLAAALAIFLLGHYTAPYLRGQSGSAEAAPGIASARASGNARLASAPNAAVPTTEGAAAVVRETQTAYLNALTLYAELANRTEAADPLARLAALESIVLTTRAALGQAPADPVINGYHLTALAQRDATLKNLASTSGQTWF